MEDKDKVENILIQNNDKISRQKKIILVLAGLFLIFIISVAVMKSIYGDEQTNQLPPEPNAIKDATSGFEQVPIAEAPVEIDDKFKKIIEEINSDNGDDLDANPQTKQELAKNNIKDNTKNDKNIAKKPKPAPKTIKNSSVPVGYYIQVGAFYEQSPNDALLNKISKNGYKYYLFKTKLNNRNVTKVLIGVFDTKPKARAKLELVRKTLSKDAYIFTKSR